MPKRIPIKKLKDLSNDLGLTHAILFAMDGELHHIVTYGKTIEQCSQAADFGNSMKKVLKWPESLQDQPSRVKKLQKQVEELKKASRIIKLEALDYNANYSYAPPSRTILINVEDISSIKQTETRRMEKCSFLKMKNGDYHTVLGSPEEIEKIIFGEN